MTQPIEILITIPIDQNIITQMNTVSPRLHFTIHPAHQPEDIPAELWAKTEVLYTYRVLPDPLQAPNLRWIQCHLSGIDNLVEAPVFQKPDVIKTTMSGAAVEQITEFLLMGILMMGHHIPAMVNFQKQREWPQNRWKRFEPVELKGSTVGIVGYGSVGRQLASMLKPLGATILAAKRDARHPADPGYLPKEVAGDPDGTLIRRLYPWQAIRTMLKDSDFVVIAVPYTPENRHLISTKDFEAMKPGSFLIDASRGGVVDHEAMISALKTGKLGGAFLDVFPEEPLPADSELWNLPNVILTPHIAGNSSKYVERAMRLFTENLQRYLDGLPLLNRFDADRGY